MDENPLPTSVQFLKGVGPARAELLKKLDIHTVGDLLWHLPRELLDLSNVRRPRDLVEKEEQTVRGVVVDMDARQSRTGKAIVAGLLDCNGEYVRGAWFGQPWMMQRLQQGDWVLWSGKPKRNQGRWEFSHPRIQWIDEEDRVTHGGLLPKYPLTEGLRVEELRKMMRVAVEEASAFICDPLPSRFREELQLPGLAEAIRQVHMPATVVEYNTARQRILFDDLFEFQLGLALRRRAWKTEGAAPVLPVTTKIDARIRRLFPFRFTAGQDAAIREISADLSSGRAMHRLLQADVGAGKTVIAIHAMLTCVASGWQAVLMAPTELLAVQHWETLERVLAQSRVRRALLTGSLTAAQRRETLARIAAGELDLVVGTQAVIQADVRFAKLGLAVIDEQHKFGVAQRSKFASGESSPHVLVMTATPIPRSLCLTQFGDLDLTVVSELPPGRQPIVTSRIAGPGAARKAWEFLRKQLQNGRQAYVVCPRIEGGDATADSTRSDDAGAVETHRQLSCGELRDYRVGLVHGQMDRDQRADVMRQFRDGEFDVLVSTTVIEVGVDVPNATLMIVRNAERFGLPQLHQLRGRIGRGKHQGYCFLFSEATAEDATARLKALEQSANGFEIAEKDFELRGPGDVLGTRQHGSLPLRVADLIRDAEILAGARAAAFELVDSGALDTAEFVPLKLRVLERFGKLFDLPQSG
ncbi:MAG: ATP-dependent DNA helicase RecG [Planctomycetaceae bacterium]|nr:ATP-dependent DNA helicase RecG [Planctomycetaceae bacterium]